MSSCCVTIAFAQGPVQMSAQRTKSMPLTFFLWSVGNVVALTRHMGEGCFLTSKFKQFKLENGCQMVANSIQFFPYKDISECPTHLRLRQGFSFPLKCNSIASLEQDLNQRLNGKCPERLLETLRDFHRLPLIFLF